MVEAPALSAPTGALPTTAPPRLKLTVVAPAAADPMFWTVAERVIALVSFGDAGVQVVALTIRSGLGAGVPQTSSSATWPDGAPVLELKRSCTSAVVAVTGMFTTLLPWTNW